LDGFNKELKIAFEFNGGQHYKIAEHWQNIKQFEETQYKDQLKVERCKKKGINLIVIPYTVKYKNLYKFIKNKFDESKLRKDLPDKIDYDDLNILSLNKDKLNDIDEYVKDRYGGTLLSTNYVNNTTHLEFKCKRSHTFSTTLGIVQSGSFCGECTYIKYKLQPMFDILKFCKNNKLKMLSLYKDAKSPIKWKCLQCNVTMTRPWDSVKSHYKVKKKCVHIKSRDDMLKELKEFCKGVSIKLLSESDYINNQSMLKLQCLRCLTKFSTNYLFLKRKDFSGPCVHILKKQDIQEKINDFSETNKLKPLNYYENSKTRLEFECYECNGDIISTYSNLNRLKSKKCCDLLIK
jgi:hypothetical protein